MNNLRKILLISVGFSAVVFGGWWNDIFSGHRGSDELVSTASLDSVKSPAIPERVKAIDPHGWPTNPDKILEELSRLKTRLASVENSGKSQTTTIVDDEIDDLTEWGLQAEQEMVEDAALHFAHQFGQEPQDPSWSSETEMIITQLLDRDDFQELEVVSTECQTSMCRVELSVDGNTSPSEVVHELLMALPFDTQSFFHNSDIENDAEHTVVYLAREDHELPRMDR